MKNITPYSDNDSKKSQVGRMFNNIARTYDLLNQILTLGIDSYWRQKAIKQLNILNENFHVLDVATGTAALAIDLANKYPTIHVTGIDISTEMLEVGRLRLMKKKLSERIQLQYADVENLEFPSNHFDACMVAFGVRNFENLKMGISEMIRVVKPGSSIIILEFSTPRSWIIQKLFGFYFKFILPLIGKLISKDAKAYRYLFESVQQFPDYERFVDILESVSLRDCQYKPLSFGICTIYSGIK